MVKSDYRLGLRCLSAQGWNKAGLKWLVSLTCILYDRKIPYASVLDSSYSDMIDECGVMNMQMIYIDDTNF